MEVGQVFAAGHGTRSGSGEVPVPRRARGFQSQGGPGPLSNHIAAGLPPLKRNPGGSCGRHVCGFHGVDFGVPRRWRGNRRGQGWTRPDPV